MRRWKPSATAGRWVGLLFVVALLAGAVVTGRMLVQRLAVPPDQWVINLSLYGLVVLFVALCAAVLLLGYRVLAAWTLSYNLDRNGLYIVWAGGRATVPLEYVQRVDIGTPVEPSRWQQLVGYAWGHTRVDNRAVFFFTTQPAARSLNVQTPDASFVISPADIEGFVQDLEQRRNLGATKPLAAAVGANSQWLALFWNDRVVQGLLATTFLVNLLVLALIAARYPQLNPLLEMRFTSGGETAALQPRHYLLFLPFAAFSLSLLNIILGLFLHRQQQLGARMLQGASVLVQVLFGIAIITLVR